MGHGYGIFLGRGRRRLVDERGRGVERAETGRSGHGRRCESRRLSVERFWVIRGRWGFRGLYVGFGVAWAQNRLSHAVTNLIRVQTYQSHLH